MSGCKPVEGRWSGMSIQVGWTVEPIQRLEKRFEKLWSWLEQIGAADWHRVHGLATHFHPDYAMDHRTRQLLPGLAPGAQVFLQMERGEYEPAWIKVCAPTLAATMPKAFRGKGAGPDSYLVTTMFLAANLAAHEYEQLLTASETKPRSDAQIARHLYFFERFDGLFRRVGSNKLPHFDINTARRQAAKERASKVLAFHLERQRLNPGRKVTPRGSAIKFAGGQDAKGFPRDYLALRTELKKVRDR